MIASVLFLTQEKYQKKQRCQENSCSAWVSGKKLNLSGLPSKNKPDFGQHLFLFPNPTLSLSGIFLKAPIESKLSFYSPCESQNTIGQTSKNLKVDFFVFCRLQLKNESIFVW